MKKKDEQEDKNGPQKANEVLEEKTIIVDGKKIKVTILKSVEPYDGMNSKVLLGVSKLSF